MQDHERHRLGGSYYEEFTESFLHPGTTDVLRDGRRWFRGTL